MSEQAQGRTAIIADRHALGRNLVRFLLEEEGFKISAEAATIAEVLLAVQHQTPDVLVVHENLARDHDPAVFAQIRQLSPNTNLVLMTGNRDDLAVELIFIADSVVEEGPGLGQLAFAAGWQAPSEVRRADVERAARARRVARRRWRPPWGERLDTRGAVAASIVVFAVMLVRAAGFSPFPDADAPRSPNPSIRAEGSAAGDSPTASMPIAFDLASSTSPADDDPSTRPSEEEPSPEPDEGPAPDGEEPGPDPTEDPPPGPDEQPPADPPASEDPQKSTVIDEVVAPVEDVVDDVVGEIDPVVDEVVDGVEAVVDGAAETVDDVVGEVVDDVDDIVEGVLGGGLSTPGLG
ncbi:MAG: response regulator [Actinomycetota bacterium]